MDLTPGVSTVKGVQEASTGKNVVEDRAMGPAERAMAGVGAVPLVGGIAKGKALIGMLKSLAGKGRWSPRGFAHGLETISEVMKLPSELHKRTSWIGFDPEDPALGEVFFLSSPPMIKEKGKIYSSIGNREVKSVELPYTMFNPELMHTAGYAPKDIVGHEAVHLAQGITDVSAHKPYYNMWELSRSMERDPSYISDARSLHIDDPIERQANAIEQFIGAGIYTGKDILPVVSGVAHPQSFYETAMKSSLRAFQRRAGSDFVNGIISKDAFNDISDLLSLYRKRLKETTGK